MTEKSNCYFSCGLNIRKNTIERCDKEKFDETINSPIVIQNCAKLKEATRKLLGGVMDQIEYRRLKDMLKRELPYFCFNGYPDATGLRKASEMHYSGLIRVDFDNFSSMAEVDDVYNNKVKPIRDEEGILLVFRSPSWLGLGVVMKIKPGMTLQQTMEHLATRIGIECDHAVFDISRASFAVAPDMILYKSDALFDDHRADAKHLEASATSADGSSAGQCEKQKEVTITVAPLVKPLRNDDLSDLPPITWKGVEIDRAEFCKEYWHQNQLPSIGCRNSRLYDFNKGLRTICDNNEDMMLRMQPEVGLSEDELKLIITNVCKRQAHVIPYDFQRAMNECKRKIEEDMALDAALGEDKAAKEAVPSYLNEPDFPAKLPPLVELLTEKTPAPLKKAVAQGIWPSLGSQLTGVNFPYVDGVLHEATLMNVLLAPTGSGKDCIRPVIREVMRDIAAADKIADEKLRRWKEACQAMPSNAQKPPRPEVYPHIIPADFTQPYFIWLSARTAPARLYSYLEEVEAFDALRTHRGGDANSQFLLIKQSFDPDNEVGQGRVSENSVSEKCCVRWNWNASSTIAKGIPYFQRGKADVDGTITRLSFSTIPERPIGAPIPKYGQYDDEWRARLKPYLDNLRSAKGTIYCPEANAMAERMMADNQRDASTYVDRKYENFTFRGTVIAWLKGCVLYVANGCKWDPLFEPFCRWSLREDLRLKMLWFAPHIEAMEQDPVGSAAPTKGPANKLLWLSDTFSVRDVADMAQKAGLRSPVRTIIASWKLRKLIAPTSTKGVFKKLKYKTGK